MLKALIVDDEIASVRILELLLSQFAKDIEVVDVARSSKEAVSKVDLIKPDLVFLDIEMPGGNGFDFLEQCSHRNFEVVFITAYENYAIKAFKYSAIDYLLKPIEVEELQVALEKVSKRRYSNFDGRNKYFALFENLKDIFPSKLVVTVDNHSEYIDLRDILYFEATQNGTIVFRNNNGSLNINNQLDDLENILDGKNFFKINDNQLVNLEKIRHFASKKGNNLELSKGTILVVLPSRRNELTAQLEEFINQKR